MKDLDTELAAPSIGQSKEASGGLSPVAFGYGRGAGSKGAVWVCQMLRWGERENHHYIVGVYSTERAARYAGEVEKSYRGGKYEFEVEEHVLDAPISAEALAVHEECSGAFSGEMKPLGMSANVRVAAKPVRPAELKPPKKSRPLRKTGKK